MATKDDYSHTYELIRNFWPDFEFPKEDLIKGSCDFVVKFYRNFINEVNDKVSFLTNEEIIDDEFEGAQYFDPIVDLYCKVARISTKMKFSFLTLSDFFNRSSKKLYTHIKCSIHFVIYVNNFLDELSMIACESTKQLTDVQELRILKEELLQEIGEISTALGELSTTEEKLDSKLKEVNREYEQMLAHKAVDDKKLAEKKKELELLQNESDNLAYEVRFLEEQEFNLNECVTSDEEFTKLKNTRKDLQEELERLSKADCTSEEKVDIKFEIVQKITKCGTLLQDLNFEQLYVATASDLKHENQINMKMGEELKSELSQHNKAKTKEAAELKVLKTQLEKIESSCNESEKAVAAAGEKLRLQYESKLNECRVLLKEEKNMRMEMSALKAEIEKVEKDKKRLNSVVAQTYAGILKENRDSSDILDSWLSDLTQYCC